MANLTVWQFESTTGAQDALTTLAELQRQHHVILFDAQEAERRAAFDGDMA